MHAAMAGQVIQSWTEVAAQLQPSLTRALDGSIRFDLPPVIVTLQTTCNPMPPSFTGYESFKPYEQIELRLPEVARVTFQPAANMPPGGSVSAQAHKSGAILEVPATMTIDAKLKTDSAFGSLVIDDVHEQTGQRVGQTVIRYKLQIDGDMHTHLGGGNLGSNRLHADLHFTFQCWLESNMSWSAQGGSSMNMQQMPQAYPPLQPVSQQYPASQHMSTAWTGGHVNVELWADRNLNVVPAVVQSGNHVTIEVWADRKLDVLPPIDGSVLSQAWGRQPIMLYSQ